MIAEFLVFAALPALLIAAALWDLGSYTIPNFLQVALICTFVLFAAVSGASPAVLGLHLVAGVVALAVGFLAFSCGFIGGGDAKLFACTALWFGLRDLPDYALISTVFGGILTLALLSFRKIPLTGAFGAQTWLMRLHEERGGIPYGAALAAGAFAVLPYTDVFRLGAAG